MKTWIKKQAILLLLILVGIGAAVGIISQRVGVEAQSKTYDIVMDYASLEEMVKKSDMDMDFWLSYFRDLGVEKLAIREETIDSLTSEYKGMLQVQYPENILGQYGWQDRYPKPVQQVLLESEYSSDLLVSVEDPELFHWIKSALDTRTDLDVWCYQAENGDGFFFLTGDGKKVTGYSLFTLPIGLDPKKQAQAQQYGYTLVPRTSPVANLNGDTFAEAVLADYKEIGTPYIINGSTVLGDDNKATAYQRMIEFLESEQVTLGMVENSNQSMNQVGTSLKALVEESGYNALRVFSMWDYIQWRYGWYNYDGPQEITNCLYRAAYERNCRLIYMKMILKEDDKNPGSYEYVTEPEAYETMLGDFMTRMNDRGFTMETMTAARNISVSYGSVVLIALGAVAAAVLLLALVFPLGTKLVYLLTALGAVGAAGVLYLMPNTGRLILSIGGGIVMPLLALVVLDQLLRLRQQKNPLIDTVLSLAGLVAMCLVGGLFAAAPLSDSAYMLEMELYRGVKVMQLIPMAGFVFYLLKSYLGGYCGRILHLARNTRKEKLQQVLDAPIKVKYLIYLALAAVVISILSAVGGYYLARTGHSTDVGMADLELELRNLMEYYLIARPRTKEFLVGYPCVMLYVWASRKDTRVMTVLSWLFGLGAVIGATSIVNTFLHIRTAYLLSLVRVLIGLGLGLVIGLIFLALAELIYRFITKRINHV